MKTYKCEEMMCEGCVNRIKKGLDGAGIKNTVWWICPSRQ